jgi:transcriptional regulator with XRE-family HTH domain
LVQQQAAQAVCTGIGITAFIRFVNGQVPLMGMARPSVARTPFAQRLTSVREALGHSSRKAFAAILGMHPDTLGGYERGDTFPDQGFLTRYKRDFSVNLDWLISGEGEMFGGIGLGADMIPLPYYADVQASAGAGLSAPSWPHSDAAVAFDQRFLREKGAAPDRCTVITARGDSMSPTIPDGSLLVVDHSQTQVSNGFIMVISLGDDLLVKRIRRRLDGLIDLISDNQAYAPETLSPDMLQQLRVVGRVVYFCRAP